MKNFFLVLIFFVITLIPCGLPVELQKKIVYYITPEKEAAHISLKKYTSGHEQLVFPSTSSIVFVKGYNIGDNYTQSKLRKLGENFKVLPHLQLWFSSDRFRIDNDLKVINTNFPNFSGINKTKNIFFDGSVNSDLVVLLTQRKDCIGSSIRDLADRGEVIQFYFSQEPAHPLSLCFHNNGDSIEYSFIAKNFDDESVSMHYHSLKHLFFKKFFTFKKKEIPIPLEFYDIKKHEFIGKDTFLMSIGNRLFFMVWDTIQTFKHQSFTRSNPQKSTIIGTQKNEQYDILSFAAYQEERTPNGRARFIVVLVGNKVERKIFFIDLLDPFTKAHPLWCAGEDNSLYDRISFVGNIVTLWVDDQEDPKALEIRLPINWVEDCLKPDLTLKIFGKMATSCKSNLEIINGFDTWRTIEAVVVPELKTEDLGTLLRPKKGGNYGMPLYSKGALYRFFGVFFVVGLILFSTRYLIKAFYQK